MSLGLRIMLLGETWGSGNTELRDLLPNLLLSVAGDLLGGNAAKAGGELGLTGLLDCFSGANGD